MVTTKSIEEKESRNSKLRSSRVSQSDVPANTLTKAIRIPSAIYDNYAGDPVSPLQLAQALNMSPTSGPFKSLTGSSIAYGLTEGGYNAKEIKLTDLGLRIVRPTEEGEDQIARVTALLKPRVINEFLNKYDRKQLPRNDIAINVLDQMGVPRDRAEKAYEMIIESAESLNLITIIKDKKYVGLSSYSKDETINFSELADTDVEKHAVSIEPTITPVENKQTEEITSPALKTPPPPITAIKNKKVFITHGKNRGLIGTIKELLKYGELEAVVSVEKESASKPVPEKLMHDMRECGAAIIHVDAENTLLDPSGEEQVLINPNVLIEIGAAMALYGKRFILLVQEGVQLPTNLQGLYEVRYSGNDLGSEGTLKLLSSINAMKDEKIPDHL